MARLTVDLPQPDSPTSPSTSPFAMEKLTLSTARSTPRFCPGTKAFDSVKWTLRFST